MSRQGRSRSREVSKTGGSATGVTGVTVSVCLADPMPDPITDVTVVNNEAGHRYEAWLGDVLAGFSEYTLEDGLVTFTHTQVSDAFGGRGVASTLIREALDDVRAGAGRKVQPLCPFVKGFIQRHEDYQDLLRPGDGLA